MYLSYANSPNDRAEGYCSKTNVLEINSCGTYKLNTKSELPTSRSNGRIDYQFIYLASGKGYFYFNGKKATVLEAGYMVLYHPGEAQKYIYYGKDKPEIYWMHFTGTGVESLFTMHGIDSASNVIYSGIHPDYIHIFKMIIWELQSQKEFYQESACLYFNKLLIMLGRFGHKDSLFTPNAPALEIEQATSYLREHYQETINIENYIENLCLSNSSFYRKFKLYTGQTPLQYLLDIRLSNAKKLSETTDYSIGEIALIVGYDNALYFSRLFHKHEGIAPKEYRIKIRG